MHLNRDTAVAIFSLMMCGALFVTTFQLPESQFGQMPSYLWPRLILMPLALLSVVLLVSSQRGTKDTTSVTKGFREWFRYYRNPIICFALFFAFLISMPILGMLLGGLAYVFLTLNLLGGWQVKTMIKHGLISIIFVLGMWIIFTQFLGVLLPEGILLRVY